MDLGRVLESLELPFEAIRYLILALLLFWLIRQGRTRAVLSRNGWTLLVWGFACIFLSSMTDLGEAVLEIRGGDLSDDLESVQSFSRGILVIAGLCLVMAGLVRFVPTVWKLDAEVEERRRAEALLRDAMAEGDRLNREKLALQEQMFQGQKMEALGRVAGGISHDFNNMLHVVGGYGEMLVEELDDGDERRAFAQRIVEASRRAQGVVEQILAFARPPSSDREAVDVSALARETVHMLSATLPGPVEIAVEGSGTGLLATANAAQVSRVLMNLCVNARDAIGEAPGRIGLRVEAATIDCALRPGPPRIDAPAPGRTRLCLSAAEPGTRCIRIEVRDTGSGIPREVLERIFEPFFTTKGVSKGPASAVRRAGRRRLAWRRGRGGKRRGAGHDVRDPAPPGRRRRGRGSGRRLTPPSPG